MDDSYGLAELHEQLLIIMDDIDRVCREHGIKYTLSDGTLLGAVREKGFIPSDDDMDMRMLRSEFERFKPIYEKEKRAEFVIGHPCNLATYAVINPTYEIKGMVKKEGAIINPWISIFPMDYVPRNKTRSKLKATKMRILTGMLGKPPQYPYFTEKVRRRWDMTDFLGRVVGRERAWKCFESSCGTPGDEDTGYCSNYTVNTKWIYVRYPSRFFASVSDIPFEDRTYMGSIYADEFLTMEYGNYMVPVKMGDHIQRGQEDKPSGEEGDQ